MPDRYDVAIVGYGPTGATLAALLGLRGLRVAVFDKRADIYPKPRAIGMDHEVMRVLQRIGIADNIFKTSHEYSPTVYLGAAGQPIQRIEITPRPHPLSWPPTSTFDQPALEAAIRKRVAKFDNVDVQLQTEVVDFAEQADGVTLRTLSARDTKLLFEARYAVCCDGANSGLRSRLGIAVENLGFEEDWIVVDVIADDSLISRLPETNIQYCDPARPSTYVICPGNHRRWEFKVLPGEDFAGDIPDDVLYRLLSPWLDKSEARIWRAASYRFRAIVASQWRSGRLVLAGDAVHQMPPFLGQGLCQGIRDASNLEWKLARILGGLSNDELLDSYQPERSGHVTEVTKAVVALGEIIGELDHGRATARDARLLEVQGGSVRPMIRQAFIPGIAHGVLAKETAGAGSVFPQPVVNHNGTQTLLDHITSGRSYLVSEARSDTVGLERLIKLASSHDMPLLSLTSGSKKAEHQWEIAETGTLIADWFSARGVLCALVRPDHYVYGTSADAGGMETLLKTYFKDVAA